jgi:hypothetical protein
MGDGIVRAWWTTILWMMLPWTIIDYDTVDDVTVDSVDHGGGLLYYG